MIRQTYTLKLGNNFLDLSERTHLMGILNVTPDSFSDGGKYFDPDSAITHAFQMVEEGVDILDIGGESTRPGAPEVEAAEEMRRVIPVIERIRQKSDVPISIDTKKSVVAESALRAGASMINDVSAFRADPNMAEVAARAGVPVVLMHMKGTPATMQQNPEYDDVVAEILGFFEERIRFAISRGIRRENILVDPGIGFGKTIRHNLEILCRLEEFHRLEIPLLVGASRKAFIGKILEKEISERLMGTAGAVAACVMKGANVLRVHDVAEMWDVCRLVDLIKNPERLETGDNTL